jgi:hypothetical protein
MANISELWLYALGRRDKRVTMLNAETTERQLVGQFLDVVRGLPEVRAELEPRDPGAGGAERRYDAQVDLRVGGKSVTVLIEAKKALYPRDVREALWQIKEFSRKWPRRLKSRPPVPMLVAEAISPGAKQLLRDEGSAITTASPATRVRVRGRQLLTPPSPGARMATALKTL